MAYEPCVGVCTRNGLPPPCIWSCSSHELPSVTLPQVQGRGRALGTAAPARGDAHAAAIELRV